MADKEGWSEEKTDMWGDKYTQHYDEHGNKTGWSEQKTDMWGDKYTQHHDQDSDKTGWSEQKTDMWGDKYTQHHDQDSDKTGWSEQKTDMWGDKYTQHHGQSGGRIGSSISPASSTSTSSLGSTDYVQKKSSRSGSYGYGGSASSNSGIGSIIFGTIIMAIIIAVTSDFSINEAYKNLEKLYNSITKTFGGDVKKSAASGSPTRVIHSYYESLNRRDVDSVVKIWKNPPNNLRELVNPVEWFKVNESVLRHSNSYSAQVEVKVMGKISGRTPERWGGLVELEKNYGEWKIVKMNLKKEQ